MLHGSIVSAWKYRIELSGEENKLLRGVQQGRRESEGLIKAGEIDTGSRLSNTCDGGALASR